MACCVAGVRLLPSSAAVRSLCRLRMGSAVWRRESSERVSCVELVAERGLQAAAESLLPSAELLRGGAGVRGAAAQREAREGGVCARWCCA